jgi:hypothetical protein
VSRISILRNISRGSWCVANQAASGNAAPIITATKSRRTRSIGKCAGIARRSGDLATRIIGGGTVKNIRRLWSATANGSAFGIKNAAFAILQTTAQLST